MDSAPATLPAPPSAERRPVTREEIDATGYGPAMKAALHLVLDGTPYRDAAREARLASHQDLHRAAKKLGLLEIHSSKLVGGFRRLVDLTNQELERRLVHDPESIATKDLAVVGGIASDKVAKYEGWGNSTRDPGTAVSAVVDRLAALEGKLTITVERTHPEAATLPPIDMTPSKTGE